MDGHQTQDNAVQQVFPGVPKLLCVWHVNQCVLAKCKNIVGHENWPIFQGAWREIIQASTVESFNNLWNAFKEKYSNHETHQYVEYLEKECLKEGQKERLVEAWTGQYLHFRIRVTSRAEAAHAYIKRYLGGKKSRGDLFSSWIHIEAAVVNQVSAVLNRTSIQRDRVPIDIDKNLFQGCFGAVTWYA